MPDIPPAGQGRPTPDAVVRRRDTPRDTAAGRAGTGRTLVVAGTPAQAAGGTRPSVVRSAAFLAHLIATAQGSPQTRVRRRAGLSEASAAYDAARSQPGTPPGRRFSTAV